MNLQPNTSSPATTQHRETTTLLRNVIILPRTRIDADDTAPLDLARFVLAQLPDFQQYHHPLVIDHMGKAELMRLSTDSFRCRKEIMMLMRHLTCCISEVVREETEEAVLLSRGIAETRAKIAKINGGIKELGSSMGDRINLVR
ncbi:MAG: hypothetical protein Q9212_001529 [Teloschistes hypoglaucus]